MSDNQQSFCALQNAAHGSTQVLRVERAEGFIQNHQVSILQQSAGDKQAAALPVGELPAGFADDLLQPRGHAPQQLAQQYLSEFGKMAKVNNTMIVPSDLANVAGILKAATTIVKEAK